MTTDNEPKLLPNTEDVQHALSTLLGSAQGTAILVSPYMKLSEIRWLERAIRAALERHVAVAVYVRADGHSVSQVGQDTEDLVALGLHVRCVPDLHAKVYWSEDRCILTSLNLLDTSMNNSIEVGVHVGRGPLHDSLKRFIDEQVVKNARQMPGTKRARAPGDEKRQRPEREETRRREREEEQRLGPERDEANRRERAATRFGAPEGMGFCIRCRRPIAANPAAPYCHPCYEEWAEWRNPQFRDRHCHSCGSGYPATKANPTCESCS